MTHREWLDLMKFPPQWSAWGLIPPELADMQLSSYQPGHEQSPEHDRHGAFQWWLARNPSEEVLVKLAHLSWLDPDVHMGGYVRECIVALRAPGPELAKALEVPSAP